MAGRFFENKVAVITGSSRGIGRATAYALAEAGASVVLNGRNTGRLEETRKKMAAEGHTVIAVPGDITSPEESRNLIEKACTKFGRIDILINNAGTIIRGKFEDIQTDILRRVIEGNLLGPAFTSRFALPYLKKTAGSLIFISSIAGLRGLPMASPYSAAKMGLTGLAESLRIELTGSRMHVGIIYVSFTKNDPDKMVLSADGSLIPVKPSFQIPQEKVARLILKSIKKKKFKTVLTLLGKLTRLILLLFPGLVDFLLKFTYTRMRKLYR